MSRRDRKPVRAQAQVHTLSYGPLPEHEVDVRLPTNGDGSSSSPESSSPVPLVVVVHGGFWKREWDRSHAADQSDALAAAGYVVATVEYRRVDQPGDGWPAVFDDMALLADTVPGLVAHAVESMAAPCRVDLARVVFVGHSAGGHLATWAASRHKLPASSPYHLAEAPSLRVVSLAGVVDLAMADAMDLGGGATRALLGGAPDECPQRWATADPSRLAPTGVPTILVHGDRDEPVPLALSQSYVAASASSVVELRVLSGADHMDLVTPGSRAWPAVLDAIADALA